MIWHLLRQKSRGAWRCRIPITAAALRRERRSRQRCWPSSLGIA